MENNPDEFLTREDASGKVCIAKDAADDLASLNLSSFSGWMAFNGGSLVDRNRSRSVVKIRLRENYFLKRFSRPPLKDFIGLWFPFRRKPTHAAVEVAAACALREAGIGTYRIVGFGEAACGIARPSFLLTAEMKGFSPLRDVIGRLGGLPRPQARAAKKEMLPGLAQFARKIHKAGITHPDFFSTHVFVSSGEGQKEFRVIDLHRCRKLGSLSLYHVVCDLAALHLTCAGPEITASDRLRFITEYLGAGSKDGTAESLARRIHGRALRIGGRAKYGRIGGAPGES